MRTTMKAATGKAKKASKPVVKRLRDETEVEELRRLHNRFHANFKALREVYDSVHPFQAGENINAYARLISNPDTLSAAICKDYTAILNGYKPKRPLFIFPALHMADADTTPISDAEETDNVDLLVEAGAGAGVVSFRKLLADALERVDDPEGDARTLLSSLVEHRPMLCHLLPFVSDQTSPPVKLRLVR